MGEIEYDFSRFNPPQHARDQMQAEATDALRGADSFILVTFEEGVECDNPFCDHDHLLAKMFGNCRTVDMMQAANAINEQVHINMCISRIADLPPQIRDAAIDLIQQGRDPE